MTKKEIAKFISKLTSYPVSSIDVDLFLSDCHARSCDIDEVSSFHGNLIVYFNDGVKGYLRSMYRYVKAEIKR